MTLLQGRLELKTLRETVSDLMVLVHRIPRQLAERHVAAMTAVELMDRLHMYARNGVAARMNRSTEMELSEFGVGVGVAVGARPPRTRRITIPDGRDGGTTP